MVKVFILVRCIDPWYSINFILSTCKLFSPLYSAQYTNFIFVILLFHWLGSPKITITAQEIPKFDCKSGNQRIDSVKFCDGVADCDNESDENICDNEAVLFYYTNETKTPRKSDGFASSSCNHHTASNTSICRDFDGFKIFNLSGIYLNTRNEFSVTLFRQSIWDLPDALWRHWSQVPSWENVRIAPGSPQIDMFYTEETSRAWIVRNFKRDTFKPFWKRITRDGSVHSSDKEDDDIHSPSVDWVTSNVYYISGTHIKTCDKDFEICQVLESKFINVPVFLTIAPIHKSLFWIEKKTNSQFSLFKYQLDMPSMTKLIYSDYLNSPKWLTNDPIRDRVYWLDFKNSKLSFYSITFEGKDLKVISPNRPISNSISSFAVFNNTLYWPDNEKKTIWKCLVTNCTNPIPFKSFTTSFNLTINQMVIYHRPWPVNRILHPCNNSSCSHLCLPNLKSKFSCYCEAMSKPLPTNSRSGYCESRTFLASYKNHLYVIALAKDWQFSPKIRKNTLNISSIATITYNSIDGTVVLTEMKEQNIFLWTPQGEALELISENGLGTITAIEHDDHANNLYWISPTNFSMIVMNLSSRRRANILNGNSSYFPFEFTLAPANGYMFVLFLENNVSVVLERMSMDGKNETRKILHKDPEARVGNFSLHYMKHYQLLCLLDRQRNEIRYFTSNNEFQDMTNSVGGKMEDIVSLGHFIIWSKDDLIIHRGWVEMRQTNSTRTRERRGSKEKSQTARVRTFEMTPLQEIPLGLKKLEDSVLKITAVVKSTKEPSISNFKCLKNNGGCSDGLCLVSEKNLGFSCLCPKTHLELMDGKSCNLQAFSRSGAPRMVAVSKETKNSRIIILCISIRLLHSFMKFK